MKDTPMHQGFSSTSNANSNGGTSHFTLFRFFTYVLVYGILVLPYFMMRNLRQTETTVEKSPVDFMFDTMETISYYKVLVNFSKIKKKSDKQRRRAKVHVPRSGSRCPWPWTGLLKRQWMAMICSERYWEAVSKAFQQCFKSNWKAPNQRKDKVKLRRARSSSIARFSIFSF